MTRDPAPNEAPDNRRSGRARRASLASALLIAFCIIASCKPKDVHDAEAREDVAFLEADTSPASTAALGRLADKSPRALAALESRAKTSDVNAYIAAWQGQVRGASWSLAIFRGGLADPARSVVAQSALPRKDPRTAELLPELEAAFVALPSRSDAAKVGALIASLGAAGKPAVTRALDKAKTRTIMCDALSSPDTSHEALVAFRTVAREKRDDAACTGLALSRADTDDEMLGWLAKDAEVGLLVAVARRGSLPCPREALLWEKALSSRPKETHAQLSGELSRTAHRCAEAMDPVLAKALAELDEARAWIVTALDPADQNLARLAKTCRAMKFVAEGGPGTSIRTRERARDAVARGCDKAQSRH